MLSRAGALDSTGGCRSNVSAGGIIYESQNIVLSQRTTLILSGELLSSHVTNSSSRENTEFEFPSKDYWSDRDWIIEHYSELMEEYPDEWIAVYNQTVVSHGKNGEEVLSEGRERTGKKTIAMMFIECGSHVY